MQKLFLRLNKWIVKHKTLAFLLFSLIELPVYASLFYALNFPVWSVVLIGCVIVFINYMFVSTALNALQKKPLEALAKGGDPEPLLYLSSELLTYKLSEPERQICLINQCVALRELGELEEARRILSSINIDKNAGTINATKVTYYNNLSDIYRLMGDTAQAEIWSDKMLQIYNDMPNNSFKRLLESAVKLSKAEGALEDGDIETARALICELEEKRSEDLPQRMALAYLGARAHLASGEIKAAEEMLRGIINEGNKLYVVTLARNKLSEINE